MALAHRSPYRLDFHNSHTHSHIKQQQQQHLRAPASAPSLLGAEDPGPPGIIGSAFVKMESHVLPRHPHHQVLYPRRPMSFAPERYPL